MKTQAAQAARAIKVELTNLFPGVKFSVKSENYSMGDSVNISWNDGPTDKEVSLITSKYQYGHFNGMEDIYEYSNNRNDIPQSKYVSCNRHLVEIEKLRDEFLKLTNSNQFSNEFYRVAEKCSLPVNATNLRIERTNVTCGSIEEFYTIAYDVPEKENKATEEVKAEEKNVIPSDNINVNDFEIIDYSEKAVAIFGNTKPIKDQLHDIGGKFNFHLSKNGVKTPGWIFPKTKKDSLINLINNL